MKRFTEKDQKFLSVIINIIILIFDVVVVVVIIRSHHVGWVYCTVL